MNTLKLTVGQFDRKNIKYTQTNKIYLSPNNHKQLQSPSHVQIGSFVYLTEPLPIIPDGTLNLSKVQRTDLNLGIAEEIKVSSYQPTQTELCTSYLKVTVGYLSQPTAIQIEADTIRNYLRKDYSGQMITKNQCLSVTIKNIVFLIRAEEVQLVDSNGEVLNSHRGILHDKIMTIDVAKAGRDGGLLTINGGMTSGTLFSKNFNPESMGIGGLDKEFTDILRRAFMSRMFNPDTIQKLGIKHVKGILLYGPPGCGKTLMARQIGKMVSVVEPKLVEGPSILNKFVGESEANIRALFQEAEDEQKERGNDSQLHIIILDEIDAICKQRGSRNDSTGVSDTIVNQLLSKIDGVNSLNNILVIGMTNRIDMLDEALLRPGRLEVQIEIGLPDEHGRHQIFAIHTKKMFENKMVDDSVDLTSLAKVTKNYSGAEIEGLVISATSFAMKENFDIVACKPKSSDILVRREHFDLALNETKPAFGVDKDDTLPPLPRDVLVYSNAQQRVREILKDSVEQLNSSLVTNKIAVLVGGRHGSGKTALAVEASKQSGFPFIKVISSEMLVGFSESVRCNKISKIFTDAYKSTQSVIIIDDLERIIEYTAFGPRFDNTSLHLLLSYIRKPVPANRKLYIVATTCLSPSTLRTLDIWEAFTQHLHLPVITGSKQFQLIAEGANMKNYIDDDGWVDVVVNFGNKSIAIQNALLLLENFKGKPYDSDEFKMLLKAYCSEEEDPWYEIAFF
ncbi:Vesicle-fusing ATPase [Entamoeba marina]